MDSSYKIKLWTDLEPQKTRQAITGDTAVPGDNNAVKKGIEKCKVYQDLVRASYNCAGGGWGFGLIPCHKNQMST